MIRSCIYFIQVNESGPIKIGFSSDAPSARLASLQTGNPWRLNLLGSVAGSAKDEQALHREFADIRMMGEWFEPTERLVFRIAEMLAPGFAFPEVKSIGEFAAIIEAFGGPVPFRQAIGLSDVHARQMKLRDSVPPGYWPRLVEAAQEQGIEGVTLDVLAGIAKAKLELKVGRHGQ